MKSTYAVRSLLLSLLVCLCSVLPGLDLAHAGYTEGTGADKGTPLTQQQKDKVAAAIKQLRTEGKGTEAKVLETILANGGICQMSPDGGRTWTLCKTSPHLARINLGANTINNLSVTNLAGLLLHEYLHAAWHYLASPSDANYDEIHCQIYYEDYVRSRKLCEASPPPAGISVAEAQSACKRMKLIESMYQNFRSHYNVHKGTSYPPAPPGGFPHHNSRIALPFPVGPLASTDPVRGDYASVGTGDLYIAWYRSSVSDAQVSYLSTGSYTIRNLFPGVTNGGKEFVVIVSSNAAGTQGYVHVASDTGTDQVVDSIAQIAGPADGLMAPNGVTSVYKNGTHKWYVLDSTAGKVWNLDDTNSDQLPDDLGSVFADSASFSDVAVAKSLSSAGAVTSSQQPTGIHQLLLRSLPSHWTYKENDRWQNLLSDANADGVADGQSGRFYPPTDIAIPPQRLSLGGAGESQVLVQGTQGSTVTVLGWSSSANSFSVSLGSSTITTANRTTVSLSRALLLHEPYLVRDVTLGMDGTPEFVAASGPTITDVTGNRGSSTGGTSVTITGDNLPASPVVVFRLRGIDSEWPVWESTASVTSSSSTSITVSSPSNSQGTLRIASIEVQSSTGSVVPGSWFFLYEN